MKKLFLYLSITLTILVFHLSCNVSNSNSDDDGNDKLNISTCIDTIVDTTFYLWKDNGVTKIVNNKPYTGDTNFEPLPDYDDSKYYSGIPFRPSFCTTFKIHDTVNLKISPETVLLFHKSHRPWFNDSNTIRAAFDTVREGIWDRIHVEAMHYPGDSAFIEFSGQPRFITYEKKPYLFWL